MEQDGDLVNLDHNIAEEELVAVLWFDLILILVPFSLVVCFAASFVQVDPVADGQIASLYLPYCFIKYNMEGRHRQIIAVPRAASHKVELKRNRVRFF